MSDLLSTQHMVLGMVLLCLDVTTHWCHHYLQVILVPVTMSCCLFAVHDRKRFLSTSESNVFSSGIIRLVDC